jgi:AcrR family transcriptional regulator
MARRRQTSAEPSKDDSWRNCHPLELSPILSAALDAFGEKGFHGATVRDIARRVGQTVPALYYHHENKEAMFIALQDLGVNELSWRVETAVEAGGDKPFPQFVNFIEAIVLQFAYRNRISALDTEIRHLSAPNYRRHTARRKKIEGLLERIVDAGTRDGSFNPKDPHETARALLGMCNAIPRWYRPSGPLTPQQLADRYVAIALMTVGADARLLRQPSSRRVATGNVKGNSVASSLT